MSLAKRIGVLILLPLAGALVALALAIASLEGLFVMWKSLGKPPEKAVKIIAIASGLYVETESGRVYSYEGSYSCGDKCWVASKYPEPDPTPYFTLDACGSLPSFVHAIDTKALCEPWGPGSYLSVYAIRNDGNVFVWQHRVGEGNTIWILMSPFVGAPIGFLVAIIIVFSNKDGRPTPRAAVERSET